MKRRYSVEDFVQLCKYIRNKNPLVSITTDYIVGFPTETKDCFRESLENLAKIKFCYMHIFPYSAREGTYASKLMNIVSDTEKKTRFTATADLISKLQTQYLKQFIGKTVNVLFEKSNETNIQKGHSEYFFMVKLKTHRNLTNQLMKVKITSLKHNQLFGTLIQRDVFTFFHPLEK
jgi:threonylcarbamoyladenosine tRNA methylthiotransferase MtaB